MKPSKILAKLERRRKTYDESAFIGGAPKNGRENGSGRGTHRPGSQNARKN